MKKYEKAGYVLIIAAVIFSAALIFAKDAPEEVLLNKVEEKVPPVLFKHKNHVDETKIECAACHHKKPEEPASCYSCHKKDKEGDAVKAKDAFHKLCVVCHKEKKAADVNPPVKCKECHIKEAPEREQRETPEAAPEETPQQEHGEAPEAAPEESPK